MILLLTDGELTKKYEEQSVRVIKDEIELFKSAHSDSSFKLLALMFGKKSAFTKKLTQETVKT